MGIINLDLIVGGYIFNVLVGGRNLNFDFLFY